MSKCVYCHARKGKRPCPALTGDICPHCCGEHRLQSIRCPAECVFLDRNVEYQQRRVGDRFELARQALYKDLLDSGGEKAAEIFSLLEAIIFKHFHDRRDGQDGEVIAAVQALRRTFSLIHVPEIASPAFTEALKKEYAAFMEGEKIDPQLASSVLDSGLAFMNEFSGHALRSNSFLNGLIGYMKSRHPEVAEQLAKMGSGGGRVVLPSGVPMEDKPTVFHAP